MIKPLNEQNLFLLSGHPSKNNDWTWKVEDQQSEQIFRSAIYE